MNIRGNLHHIVLLIFLGGVVYLAGSYYTVKTSEGFSFYSKKSFSLDPVYVNATELNFTDLRDYPYLVKSMVSKGDVEHLPGGKWINKLSGYGEDVNQILKDNNSIKELKSNIIGIPAEGTKSSEEKGDKPDLKEKAKKIKKKIEEGADEIKNVIE